jgi:hypothetical protein
MSDDFIRALQGDLVDAFERYERRSPARALRPRLWRPGAMLAAATIVALVAVVVVVARNLEPAPSALRPRVLAVLPIGGTPVDGAVADGSLWVSDFKGSVVRIDPDAHRVLERIDVPAGLGPIAAEGGSVWVRSAPFEGCSGGLWLVRVDASANRAIPRRSVARGNGVAVEGGAVWVPRCLWPPNGIDRLDHNGALTARAPVTNADGIVAGTRELWAITHDGTVAEIDARTARVTQRYPAVAPLSDPNTTEAKALVPDDTGAWVLSTGRAAIFRIASGHVVRRIGIGSSAAPLLARARDGLWVAFADRLGSGHRLERIDPVTGKVTATLELGTRRPLALVAAGDRLCVVTQDGNVLFVGA